MSNTIKAKISTNTPKSASIKDMISSQLKWNKKHILLPKMVYRYHEMFV